MYNKALIILSFVEKIDVSHLNAISSISDYIICADGGVDIAKTYGIMPDCVIGDFDSTINSNRLDCLYITLPSEKDFTDTEAAINHAIELGIRDITVYGGIGGRLDHTLGNVGLCSCLMANHVVQRFSHQFLTTDSFRLYHYIQLLMAFQSPELNITSITPQYLEHRHFVFQMRLFLTRLIFQYIRARFS